MSIVQNDTTPRWFYMSLASDSTGRTPAPDLSPLPVMTIGKAGAAFITAAGTVTQPSTKGGWYVFTPTSADTGTLGDLAFQATAATADTWRDNREVVAAGPLAVDWTSGRAAEIDTINTTTTAIAGYVDTEVAAIKAVTDKIALDGSGGVSIAAADKTALLNTILGAVIETNGGITVTVKQALQLAAALPAGAISDILAGAGTQTIHVASASGQPFLTLVGDEIGNRIVTRNTLS